MKIFINNSKQSSSKIFTFKLKIETCKIMNYSNLEHGI